MLGRDLVSEVSGEQMTLHADPRFSHSGVRPHIAALDIGTKASTVRRLIEGGAIVELHPSSASLQELLGNDPDAVLLAGGPGDPAALDHILKLVRAVLGERPVYGIGLGQLLLGRALGLSTFRLPSGHRGSNHPVKDLRSGRIEITTQHHGFALAAPAAEQTIDTRQALHFESDFGAAQLTHVNLYDKTIEGLRLLEIPVCALQYAPPDIIGWIREQCKQPRPVQGRPGKGC
jgi:carbamoyl-phosphate synthase small subunit